MRLDRNGLEVLDREECLRLLGTVSVCRVGVNAGSLPMILPVNFALDGDLVVIRSARGTKLDNALHNAVVVLEADEYDPASSSGWSVMVRGRSFEIVDPDHLELVANLNLQSWSAGRFDNYIGVHTESVTGRRLVDD